MEVILSQEDPISTQTDLDENANHTYDNEGNLPTHSVTLEVLNKDTFTVKEIVP